MGRWFGLMLGGPLIHDGVPPVNLAYGPWAECLDPFAADDVIAWLRFLMELEPRKRPSIQQLLEHRWLSPHKEDMEWRWCVEDDESDSEMMEQEAVWQRNEYERLKAQLLDDEQTAGVESPSHDGEGALGERPRPRSQASQGQSAGAARPGRGLSATPRCWRWDWRRSTAAAGTRRSVPSRIHRQSGPVRAPGARGHHSELPERRHQYAEGSSRQAASRDPRRL